LEVKHLQGLLGEVVGVVAVAFNREGLADQPGARGGNGELVVGLERGYLVAFVAAPGDQLFALVVRGNDVVEPACDVRHGKPDDDLLRNFGHKVKGFAYPQLPVYVIPKREHLIVLSQYNSKQIPQQKVHYVLP
jgi:hypothetical protein